MKNRFFSLFGLCFVCLIVLVACDNANGETRESEPPSAVTILNSDNDVYVDLVKDSSSVAEEKPNIIYTRYQYMCNDEQVDIVVRNDETAEMMTGKLFYLLKQVESVSGVKYETPDSPETFFWNRGDDVQIQINGRILADCQIFTSVNPFNTGFGQEPGWRFEIKDDILTIETDYGAKNLSGTIIADHQSYSIRHVVAENAKIQMTMVLHFDFEDCQDTMSGAVYPARVSLVVNNDPYLTGCAGEEIITPLPPTVSETVE